MARVACYEVSGIEMWIPSGDHGPPHFHARKPGHWHARVYFMEQAEDMVKPVQPPDAKIRGADRRAITAGAESNRVALLREWEACQAE